MAEGEAAVAAAAAKSVADVARRRREFEGADAFDDTVFVQEIESSSRVEGVAQEGESESKWDAGVGSCDGEGQRLP